MRRDIKAVNVRFAFFVISVLFFASVTNAQPPDARMTSCDPTVVRSRIDEMLRDPKTLREPPSLMLFAMNMNSVGGVAEEELGFLWFAGRLRSERFVLFEQGDPSKMYQVYLAVEKETVRLNMLPSLESDPELLQRVVKRVIAWDKATPDPYRDRPEAQTVELKNRLAEIDKSFSRLPKEFADYLAGINKPPDAWDTPQRRKGVAEYRYAQRCASGKVDSIYMEAAIKQIEEQTKNLVKTHPLVLQQAGGTIGSQYVYALHDSGVELPWRVVVRVESESEVPQSFFVHVGVESTVTSERKIGAIKTSLTCITRSDPRNAPMSWKDVCEDDPNAIKPNQH